MSEPRLFRRHLESCEHASEGRKFTGCQCPIWCDHRIGGRRILKALGTSSWERAQRKLARVFDPESAPREVSVTLAIAHYIDDCEIRNLRHSTIRSYRKSLEHLGTFCSHEQYSSVGSINLEALTVFRATRTGRNDKPAKPSTLRKELEALRAFFAFTTERGWTTTNVAKRLKPPKESGLPTMPFEEKEISAILRACDAMGNREHDNVREARKRMRAFLLLLLYSGLRISDAAGLKRSRLNPKTGHLTLRQMKTGAALSVKLPAHLVEELAALPGEEYFFWSGTCQLSTIVGNLRQTIASVLKAAGVIGHPHRFRDTFAVRLLLEDVPIRTVQLLLGHSSVRTTEKHYAPFVQSQQRLLDEAVAKLDFLGSSPEPPKDAAKNVVRNTKRNMRASA